MTTTEPSASESASYTSLLGDTRLLSVVLLSVVATFGNNVAAPALPAMGAALGVSDARLGLVITTYTLGAMVAVPVTGVLADMFGRRTVVIPSIAGFGLFGAGVAAVGSFEAVLLLRGLQGVAVAGVMPLTVTMLGDLYDGERGTAAQGLRVSLNGTSSIVLPVAAGAVSALAWNYPFLLYGLALPAAAVAYRYLPETADVVDAELRLVTQLRTYVGTIRGELGRSRTATLLAGAGVRDFVRYAVITFVPLLAVRTLGASYATAGALLSLRGVAFILLSPLAGRIVGAVSHRWALVGSLVLAAVSMALLPFAPSVLAVAVVLFGYSAADAVFSPVIKDAVTDASSTSSRAGVVGSMNVLKFAGQAASPVAFGLVLAASGFEPLFLLGAGILAAYAVVVASRLA